MLGFYVPDPKEPPLGQRFLWSLSEPFQPFFISPFFVYVQLWFHYSSSVSCRTTDRNLTLLACSVRVSLVSQSSHLGSAFFDYLPGLSSLAVYSFLWFSCTFRYYCRLCSFFVSCITTSVFFSRWACSFVTSLTHQSCHLDNAFPAYIVGHSNGCLFSTFFCAFIYIYL